jgi:DNA (cytosine-5)-methyltransferase 1
MNKVISLFSGCGGLDLGFKRAGFDVIWANEYDKDIWETYRFNHPSTYLDTRDVRKIPLFDIPACDGIIGGPPCQPWSEGGKMLGIKDERGLIFYDYIRILNALKPLFFVVENVPGLLLEKHRVALNQFIQLFQDAGYVLSLEVLDALNFRIPQNRKRLFLIGFRKDMEKKYLFPVSFAKEQICLRHAIGDITEIPHYYDKEPVAYNEECPNHDSYTGEYDAKYMARNRVRSWDEPSFTIQALAKNAPIHPQAPIMIFINKDKRIFVPGKEYLYRRLSVRECARIQTFPDHFQFFYSKIEAGYRMVGNAVPVRLSYAIASVLKEQLK